MRRLCFVILAAICLLPMMAVNAAPAAKKNWTFLIYLNGNNNLDYYGKKNIIDMEKVGSNDQVNVVVQWASQGTKKTSRLLVLKSDDETKVTSPIIEDMGLVDMGDQKSLRQFIRWGVKNFPADHYFIDVWDHGSGWHSIAGKRSDVTSMGDISHDYISGHVITTEELGEVMTFAAKLIGHKVDIYGSDACLMGMAEVAAEMKDAVSISIGSQHTEPANGWIYDKLLAGWEAIPNASSEQVAKIVARTYVNFYRREGAQVTMSAYDLTKLSAYENAIAALGNNLKSLSASDRAKVLSAAKGTLHFAFPEYADMSDFITQITSWGVVLDEKVIADLQAATTDLVIANNKTLRYANAAGVSVWLPTSKMDYTDYKDRYTKMHFNQDTNWNDALSWMLNR